MAQQLQKQKKKSNLKQKKKYNIKILFHINWEVKAASAMTSFFIPAQTDA